jgi:hypothetical protein
VNEISISQKPVGLPDAFVVRDFEKLLDDLDRSVRVPLYPKIQKS